MAEQPVNIFTVGETLIEFASQILMLIGYWIDWLFTEHLLLGNVVSAGLLLGLADFSIQTLETYILGTRRRYDRTRNYRSMQVGMVLGVFNHVWYAFLESYLQGTGLTIVFKKIACDQAVAGPFFSSAFLVGMGLLEGKPTHEVYAEWRQKFIHIYMVDWMFWPLAQFINFHLVPYRFRVFYVNFATFLWNTFLCFAKHNSHEEIKKHQSGTNDQNSSGVIYHRIPEGVTERNNSRTRWSRKCLSFPSKSATRSTKFTRRKRSSNTPSKPLSAKSKHRHRHHSRTAAQGSGDDKQSSKPALSRSSTISSIISVKELLPMLGSYSDLNQVVSSMKDLGEDSSPTEDRTNCSPSSTGSCSSSIGSSISTKVASPISAAICLPVPDRSVSTRIKKVPTVRKLGTGTFTTANAKQSACVRSINEKREPGTGVPYTLRRGISKQTKSSLKPENSSAAEGNVIKQSWMPQSKAGVPSATKPLRRYPAIRHVPSTAQASEEVRDALKEFQKIILKGQRELKDELAETRAQVARLQELCAVTYVSVDDGTKDLALKADQLAAWVQMERKQEMDHMRTMMKEVMATKPL
ncbi:Mpv17-like protein 2 [Elysia marginata]|uniref:Mpv17-like protein 2 n=1 Tax=Elysia marginata TaxID=1093978 RepID=A0AAV4GBX5_9GAST|nr:Mpv17-like protein 2 [Elysia marginata]